MGSNNQVPVAQGHISGLKAMLLHKLHLVAACVLLPPNANVRQPVTKIAVDSSFGRCDNITLDS